MSLALVFSILVELLFKLGSIAVRAFSIVSSVWFLTFLITIFGFSMFGDGIIGPFGGLFGVAPCFLALI